MDTKKRLPSFATDEEAEEFVANSDLSEYDLTGGVPLRFEFRSKNANISMRVPQPLLTAVKKRAAEEGLPYQRYIRQVLEQALAEKPQVQAETVRQKKAG